MNSHPVMNISEEANVCSPVDEPPDAAQNFCWLCDFMATETSSTQPPENKYHSNPIHLILWSVQVPQVRGARRKSTCTRRQAREHLCFPSICDAEAIQQRAGIHPIRVLAPQNGSYKESGQPYLGYVWVGLLIPRARRVNPSANESLTLSCHPPLCPFRLDWPTWRWHVLQVEHATFPCPNCGGSAALAEPRGPPRQHS